MICLHNKNIDKNKWDLLVNVHHENSVYALSNYLDALSNDWYGIIWGDYEAVYPLFVKKKLIFNILYQPFFTRYFDIYGHNTCDKYLELTAYIQKNYDRVILNFPKTECPIPVQNSTVRVYQNLKISAYKPNENARRKIKKLKQMNCWVEEIQSCDFLIQNFEQLVQRKNLNELKKSDLAVLDKLMKKCMSANFGRIFQVVDEQNQILAQAFFLFHNERIVYLKGASSKEGLDKGAMVLIFDHVINSLPKHFIFDFGGSNDENVARFFYSMGGKDVQYLSWVENISPILRKIM
jgi:hypothetical protein